MKSSRIRALVVLVPLLVVLWFVTTAQAVEPTLPAHARVYSSLARSGSMRVMTEAALQNAATTTPDAYEPDDTTVTASPLAIGSTSATHTFTSTDPFVPDVDMHAVQVVAGQTYQFDTLPLDDRTITFLELVDASGNTLVADLYSNFTAPTNEASVVWTAPATRTYYLAITDVLMAGGTYKVRATALGSITPGRTERIEGADRYEIAATLSQQAGGGWSGVKSVVVASGLDRSMADALSASMLCGVLDSPILLVRADRAYLPSATEGALRGLRRDNAKAHLLVHIVGGPASVPSWVEKKIRSIVGSNADIERIGGADRYAVAANVTKHARAHYISEGYVPHGWCFVVNGGNAACFSDALAVAPWAARFGVPVVLVKNGVIPAASAATLKQYPDRILVGVRNVGAYDSVLKALGSQTSWIGGWDRASVARNVADFADFESFVPWTSQWLVVNKLSDAVTAGVGMPTRFRQILFTGADALDEPTQEFTEVRGGTRAGNTVTIIGGDASVSPSVEQHLLYLLGNTSPTVP